MDAITNVNRENYKIIDKIYAFLFAILLLVQPIKSFLPVTLSMAIILLTIPYLFYLLIRNKFAVNNVLFVALYAVYRIINHGTTVEEFITMIFLILFVIVLNNNRFDFDEFFKWAVRICCLASACVILQVIIYYVANTHIPFLNVGMLRRDLLEYDSLISTGISGGAYRPSAFFLEPSAFTQYAYPVLFYLLFKDKSGICLKTAIFISIGIVACTSGMGIMLTLLMWGIYLFYNSFHAGKINRRWLGVFCLAIIAIIIAYIASPQLQYSIARIFQGTNTTNSAIQGRLGGGQYYISQLNRSEFFLGTGDSGSELSMYMSAFYHLIYTDGVICVILFFLIFLTQPLKKKGFDRLLPAIIVLISFFSDISLIHSLTYLLIYDFSSIESIDGKGQRIKFILKK